MEIKVKLDHFTFIGLPIPLVPHPKREDYSLIIIKRKSQQLTIKSTMEENKAREVIKKGGKEERKRETNLD